MNNHLTFQDVWYIYNRVHFPHSWGLVNQDQLTVKIKRVQTKSNVTFLSNGGEFFYAYIYYKVLWSPPSARSCPPLEPVVGITIDKTKV
jgi:hypothetical protein